MRRHHRALINALFTYLLLLNPTSGQITKAVVDDSHVDVAGNKYLQREAHLDEDNPITRYH